MTPWYEEDIYPEVSPDILKQMKEQDPSIETILKTENNFVVIRRI